MMAKNYNRLFKEYPEHITKEQFYQICKVSKKTALYYLESGLVPAIDSGKQTRRFKIAITDVVAFLKQRDQNPNQYKASPGWYKGNSVYKRRPPYRFLVLEKNADTVVHLERWLSDYPDLMKPGDVAKATGYGVNTVVDWCSSGKLHNFFIRRAFLIPKLSLIDYMFSETFRGIKVKRNDYDSFLDDFQK